MSVLPYILIAGASAAGSYLTGKQNRESVGSTNRANLQQVRETNEANLQQVRETNASNQLINEAQLQHALGLQKMQNEYNSPQNQVNMLRSAGLNPALAFGDSLGQSSVALPSSIPNESARFDSAHFEAPQTQYSDTFIAPALQSVSAFLQNQKTAHENKIAGADSTVALAEAMKRLDESDARISELLSRSERNSAERDSLVEQKEANIQARRLVGEQFTDLAESVRVQNQYYKMQTNAFREQARLDFERSLTEKINRVLAVNADSRAASLVSSQVAKLAAEVTKLQLEGRLTEQQTENAVQDWIGKFYDNIVKDNESQISSSTLKAVIRSIENDAKRSTLDLLFAPFKGFNEITRPVWQSVPIIVK